MKAVQIVVISKCCQFFIQIRVVFICQKLIKFKFVCPMRAFHLSV
jgi:hypothetical protein